MIRFNFTKTKLLSVYFAILTVVFLHTFAYASEKNIIGGESEALNILSMDGGGGKGIILVTMLKYIEEKAGMPISHLFDMMGGTSIGGVLTLALNVPKEEQLTKGSKSGVASPIPIQETKDEAEEHTSTSNDVSPTPQEEKDDFEASKNKKHLISSKEQQPPTDMLSNVEPIEDKRNKVDSKKGLDLDLLKEKLTRIKKKRESEKSKTPPLEKSNKEENRTPNPSRKVSINHSNIDIGKLGKHLNSKNNQSILLAGSIEALTDSKINNDNNRQFPGKLKKKRKSKKTKTLSLKKKGNKKNNNNFGEEISNQFSLKIKAKKASRTSNPSSPRRQAVRKINIQDCQIKIPQYYSRKELFKLSRSQILPQKADFRTPKYTAKDLEDFFTVKNGKKIFKTSLGYRIWSGWGWLGSKYDSSGRKAFFKEHLGGFKMSECITNCMITGFSLGYIPDVDPQKKGSSTKNKEPKTNIFKIEKKPIIFTSYDIYKPPEDLVKPHVEMSVPVIQRLSASASTNDLKISRRHKESIPTLPHHNTSGFKPLNRFSNRLRANLKPKKNTGFTPISSPLASPRVSPKLKHKKKPKVNFYLKRRLKSKEIYKKSKDYAVNEVAEATSAAPTYFDPVILTNMAGQKIKVVDGGVVLNNPALQTFIFGKKKYPHARVINILSLGCGENKEPLNIKRYGLLSWGTSIFDILLNGVSNTTNIQLTDIADMLNHIPGYKVNYLRIQPNIPKDYSAMDKMTKKNLDFWKKAAEETLTFYKPKLDEFIEKVKLSPRLDIPKPDPNDDSVVIN